MGGWLSRFGLYKPSSILHDRHFLAITWSSVSFELVEVTITLDFRLSFAPVVCHPLQSPPSILAPGVPFVQPQGRHIRSVCQISIESVRATRCQVFEGVRRVILTALGCGVVESAVAEKLHRRGANHLPASLAPAKSNPSKPTPLRPFTARRRPTISLGSPFLEHSASWLPFWRRLPTPVRSLPLGPR